MGVDGMYGSSVQTQTWFVWSPAGGRSRVCGECLAPHCLAVPSCLVFPVFGSSLSFVLGDFSMSLRTFLERSLGCWDLGHQHKHKLWHL